MLCPAEEVSITEVWGQGRGRGGRFHPRLTTYSWLFVHLTRTIWTIPGAILGVPCSLVTPGRQHIIINGDPDTKKHEDPGQDLRDNTG